MIGRIGGVSERDSTHEPLRVVVAETNDMTQFMTEDEVRYEFMIPKSDPASRNDPPGDTPPKIRPPSGSISERGIHYNVDVRIGTCPHNSNGEGQIKGRYP